MRRLLIASLALCGAVLAPLAPGAFAQHSTCRSDPIVSLGNGATIDLTTVSDLRESDIQRIEYVIHAPPGTVITHITFTQGGLGGREWFSLVDDAPANTYITDTVVRVHSSDGTVTATTVLHGGKMVTNGQATGLVNQHLSVTV